MSSFVPVYDLNLSLKARVAAINSILSGWISSNGSYVDKFESKFSSLFPNHYAVTCCNGTAALHLALLSCGVKANDVVIVPSFTYIATVNAIRYCNAYPLFVDIDPFTWQIDLDLLDSIPSENAKYLLLPHIYGSCTDMNRLSHILNSKGWILIEDCAESLGSQFQGRSLGTFGKASTFSFFGNKTISTGEGGMVLTGNLDVSNNCKFLRSHAMDSECRYWHTDIGYNYRLNNVASAIGYGQLFSFSSIIKNKLNLHDYYKSNLSDLPIAFQKFHESCLPWMTSIIFESSDILKKVCDSLNTSHIGWRPLFYPAHTMSMYKSFPYISNNDISSSISCRGLSIPSFPSISSRNRLKVVNAIRSAFL